MSRNARLALSESLNASFNVIEAMEFLRHYEVPVTSHESPPVALQQSPPRNAALKRVFLLSHHIYSESKRRSCTQWAKELSLSGRSPIQ